MSHRIEEPIRYLILFEVKDTTGSVTFVALDSKVQDMVQPTEFKLLSGSGINYIDQTFLITNYYTQLFFSRFSSVSRCCC